MSLSSTFRRRIMVAAIGLAMVMSTVPACAATAPPSDWDITRQGLVWQVPEMSRARIRTEVPYAAGASGPLTMDLYYPAAAVPPPSNGAVVFVNGVGDIPGNQLRHWQIYCDWARAVAARGLVGIVYGAETGRTSENLAALFEHLKTDGRALGIDPERLGLFACSANVTTGLPFTVSPGGASLRAAVIFYGNAAADSLRRDLPVLYVRAEQDGARLNEGIDRIWQRARAAHLPWTMIEGAGLPHAFDALDVSDGSRALVQQALDFWCTHLSPLPAAPQNSPGRRVNRAIYAGDFATAARMLEPLYQGGTSEPDVGRLLLHCYRNLGDLEHGLPLADEQVRLHPDTPGLWSTRGALLLAADRPADAAASFETSLGLGARDLFTYNQIVTTHLAAGNLTAAIRRGREAAGLFPYSSAIHYNLACALARDGQSSPALDALAAAVRAGFRDRKGMEDDPDLASLRAESRFRELVEGMAE